MQRHGPIESGVSFGWISPIWCQRVLNKEILKHHLPNLRGSSFLVGKQQPCIFYKAIDYFEEQNFYAHGQILDFMALMPLC